MKEELKLKQAIKELVWMARRYANGRQTYATQSFNDAYDVLRTEFGDEIESPSEQKHEFPDFPYATDGGGEAFNSNLKNRPFHKLAQQTLERSKE